MTRLIIFSFLVFGFSSWSAELNNYHRPIWAMGMGGVHTVFPRVADMPTTNAAYLRYVKQVGVEVFSLGLGGPGLSKVQEFQDLPNPDSLSGINDYLGRPVWIAFDGRASVVLPYFGVSAYNNVSLSSFLNNPLVPEMHVNYLSDYGFTAGFAIPLGPEVSFGIGFKKINRWGAYKVIDFTLIDDYISSEDTDVILDEFQDKGVGYGMDLSFLYRKEGSSGPIFTLVWKDVGYTTFQKTAGSKAPPSIHDNLIMGVGYELGADSTIGTKVGLEYRHIRTDHEQFGKKLHLGAELSLPLIDLRAGLNQGYMTYGMGFDLWVLRFEMAQYTEELGAYPGQKPDPRLQMGIMLDLSVDADFKITSGSDGANGNKRKLKQRR